MADAPVLLLVDVVHHAVEVATHVGGPGLELDSIKPMWLLAKLRAKRIGLRQFVTVTCPPHCASFLPAGGSQAVQAARL